MRDIGDKVDNTAGATGELSAAEYNDHKNEFQEAAERSGQTLSQSLTPDQHGRAMFINGVAALSMQDSGTANAIQITPVTGISGLIFAETLAQLDGAVFEFDKPLVNTSGVITVNVGQDTGSLLPAKNLKNATGGNLGIGEVFGRVKIRYDSSADEWWLVQQDIPEQVFHRGSQDGVILSNNTTDANNDIDFSPGVVRGAANVWWLFNEAIIVKQLDVAHAVGTNAGGLFSGSKAADTWYHCFVIRRDSDGLIDAGFDTDPDAANIPAGFTAYRRRGAVRTDGSGDILAFIQDGDDFTLDDMQHDLDTTVGTTATLVTLTVPTGFRILSRFRFGLSKAAATPSGLVTDPNTTDVVPSTANGANVQSQSAGSQMVSELRIRTNTSAQVRVRMDEASVNGDIWTAGWDDRRGRDA